MTSVRVRDIMTRDVIAIGPDVSIRDAMALLSSRHISGAPVIAGGKIVGVITSTDVMGFAAELLGAPATRDEPAVFEDSSTTDEEIEREVGPLGSFFTDLWEDAGEDVDLRFDEVTGPERNVLDAHTVEEAMTRAPIFEVSGETSLPATAEFMRTHAIHRVMVSDRGALVGIVTRTDLANAVADHKLREHQYVFGTDPRLPRLDPRKPPHIERTLGSRLEHKGETNKE
jgi:CBS domain-containing protein